LKRRSQRGGERPSEENQEYLQRKNFWRIRVITKTGEGGGRWVYGVGTGVNDHSMEEKNVRSKKMALGERGFSQLRGGSGKGFFNVQEKRAPSNKESQNKITAIVGRGHWC